MESETPSEHASLVLNADPAHSSAADLPPPSASIAIAIPRAPDAADENRRQAFSAPATRALIRGRSRSRVPFSSYMLTVALHVYNNRGVRDKNTRDEVRRWHWKGFFFIPTFPSRTHKIHFFPELHARTAVGEKCHGCRRVIEVGEPYFLNYPHVAGAPWSQGIEPHCEVCMGEKLRRELGQDDAEIKAEFEQLKAHGSTGADCLIC